MKKLAWPLILYLLLIAGFWLGVWVARHPGPPEEPLPALVRVTAPGAVRLRSEAAGVVIRTIILPADMAARQRVPAVVIWVERNDGTSTRVAIGPDGLGTLMRITGDTGEELK